MDAVFEDGARLTERAWYDERSRMVAGRMETMLMQKMEAMNSGRYQDSIEYAGAIQHRLDEIRWSLIHDGYQRYEDRRIPISGTMDLETVQRMRSMVRDLRDLIRFGDEHVDVVGWLNAANVNIYDDEDNVRVVFPYRKEALEEYMGTLEQRIMNEYRIPRGMAMMQKARESPLYNLDDGAMGIIGRYALLE